MMQHRTCNQPVPCPSDSSTREELPHVACESGRPHRFYDRRWSVGPWTRFAGGIGALMIASWAGAAEVSLPDEVRHGLEENAKQLSPITVTSTMERKSSIPHELAVERLKWTMPPAQLFVKSHDVVTWQDGKAYARLERFDGNDTPQTVSELARDGQTY